MDTPGRASRFVDWKAVFCDRFGEVSSAWTVMDRGRYEYPAVGPLVSCVTAGADAPGTFVPLEAEYCRAETAVCGASWGIGGERTEISTRVTGCEA